MSKKARKNVKKNGSKKVTEVKANNIRTRISSVYCNLGKYEHMMMKYPPSPEDDLEFDVYKAELMKSVKWCADPLQSLSRDVTLLYDLYSKLGTQSYSHEKKARKSCKKFLRTLSDVSEAVITVQKHLSSCNTFGDLEYPAGEVYRLYCLVAGLCENAFNIIYDKVDLYVSPMDVINEVNSKNGNFIHDIKRPSTCDEEYRYEKEHHCNCKCNHDHGDECDIINNDEENTLVDLGSDSSETVQIHMELRDRTKVPEDPYGITKPSSLVGLLHDDLEACLNVINLLKDLVGEFVDEDDADELNASIIDIHERVSEYLTDIDWELVVLEKHLAAIHNDLDNYGREGDLLARIIDTEITAALSVITHNLDKLTDDGDTSDELENIRSAVTKIEDQYPNIRQQGYYFQHLMGDISDAMDVPCEEDFFIPTNDLLRDISGVMRSLNVVNSDLSEMTLGSLSESDKDTLVHLNTIIMNAINQLDDAVEGYIHIIEMVDLCIPERCRRQGASDWIIKGFIRKYNRNSICGLPDKYHIETKDTSNLFLYDRFKEWISDATKILIAADDQGVTTLVEALKQKIDVVYAFMEIVEEEGITYDNYLTRGELLMESTKFSLDDDEVMTPNNVFDRLLGEFGDISEFSNLLVVDEGNDDLYDDEEDVVGDFMNDMESVHETNDDSIVCVYNLPYDTELEMITPEKEPLISKENFRHINMTEIEESTKDLLKDGIVIKEGIGYDD